MAWFDFHRASIKRDFREEMAYLDLSRITSYSRIMLVGEARLTSYSQSMKGGQARGEPWFLAPRGDGTSFLALFRLSTGCLLAPDPTGEPWLLAAI